MKTIIKNNIVVLIIVAILFSGIGAGATLLYNSNSVTYSPSDNNWQVDNVKSALDELYSNQSSKQESFDIGVYYRSDANAFSWTYLECENCTTLKLGSLICYDKTSVKFNMTIKDVTNNTTIMTIPNQSANSFNSSYAGTNIDIPDGCKKIKIELGSSLANSDYLLSGNELS